MLRSHQSSGTLAAHPWSPHLSPLQVDESTVQKIAALTPNIGVAYSGMGPDSRVLVRKARKQAQAYYRLYKEQIPVAQLCRELATVMQEFTREPTPALLSKGVASWPAASVWACWALLNLHCASFKDGAPLATGHRRAGHCRSASCTAFWHGRPAACCSGAMQLCAGPLQLGLTWLRCFTFVHLLSSCCTSMILPHRRGRHTLPGAALTVSLLRRVRRSAAFWRLYVAGRGGRERAPAVPD